MSAIYVEITETRGSVPRDAGTVMKVTKQGQSGTIGGGRLEFEALIVARELLQSDTKDDVVKTVPLGPNLGQCCGGAVTLRYTRMPGVVNLREAARLRPVMSSVSKLLLWLWGAGHVGRAVVDLAPPRLFDIVWADTSLDRFPNDIPSHVTPLPAADLPRAASQAPPDAHHLIFTYSHDIDLDLCAALLQREAASVGLIGSATKRTRFFMRLRTLGLDPTPIICPIGDKSLGKHPDMIAQGVINGFLREQAA